MRAGYLRASGAATELGERVLRRLVATAANLEDALNRCSVRTWRTEDAELYCEATAGEIALLVCPRCHYAGIAELAQSDPPAPVSERMQPLTKVSTPECTSIETLSRYLAIPPQKTAKAMIFRRISDHHPIFAVLRGDCQLSRLKLGRTVGEVSVATADEIEAIGAVPGYASPIGLSTPLVIIDRLVAVSPNLAAGANEVGYHFQNSNVGRDYEPELVADIRLAQEGEPCIHCGTPLLTRNGSRVQSGDEVDKAAVLIALAESSSHQEGLLWPRPVSPFDVELIELPARDVDTHTAAERAHASLEQAGISVLYDDREERAGVKFNDADLIGIPIRVTVGARALRNGMLELRANPGAEPVLVSEQELIDAVRAQMAAQP
jgi:prolyl-tRNA synthetase